jgi:pSer/pThr/pTyr-binding forkhead associated (FHA) protein
MSGADDGKVFEFDKVPIILGRHRDDDVCLPYDVRVSRHHARIIKEGNSYFIEDVGPEGKGSTNGTYIDDRKVTTKTPLSSGEIISVGSVLVKFEKPG